MVVEEVWEAVPVIEDIDIEDSMAELSDDTRDDMDVACELW